MYLQYYSTTPNKINTDIMKHTTTIMEKHYFEFNNSKEIHFLPYQQTSANRFLFPFFFKKIHKKTNSAPGAPLKDWEVQRIFLGLKFLAWRDFFDLWFTPTFFQVNKKGQLGLFEVYLLSGAMLRHRIPYYTKLKKHHDNVLTIRIRFY